MTRRISQPQEGKSKDLGLVVIGKGLSGLYRPKDLMPTLKISQVNDQSDVGSLAVASVGEET